MDIQRSHSRADSAAAATAAFRAASLYAYVTSAEEVTVDDVRRCLDFGADVNHEGTHKCTPLHAYLRIRGPRRLDVVDAMLAAGADLNARELCGFTPLHMYVCYSDVELEVLQGLVDRGARVDATGRGGMATDALFGYICSHDIDEPADSAVVELLIRAGANVRARGDGGRTVLHMYAGSFTVNPAIVRMLLEAGADASATDERAQTALDVMVRSVGANVEALRLLLDAGVPVATARDERRRTPLHHHADSFRANADVVRELLRAGCDPSATDVLLNTPLHSLATFCTCKRSVLAQLLAHGADINARNAYGHTPLHYAAIYNPAACARLIAAGADVCARTPDDRTPLTGMIMRNSLRAVRAALNTSPPLYIIALSLDSARQHVATAATRECVAAMVLRGGTRHLSAPVRAMHQDLIAACETEVTLMADIRLGTPETSLLDIVRARSPSSVLLPPRAHLVLPRLCVYRELAAGRLRQGRHLTRLVDSVVRRVCPCALPPEMVRGVLAHVPVNDLRATLRQCDSAASDASAAGRRRRQRRRPESERGDAASSESPDVSDSRLHPSPETYPERSQ